MAEYVIERVSQEEPREWGEGEKKTYYIKVMLKGHDRPVSIGKKSPDALKVGDVVHGTITETQYDTDKFTADKPAFGGKNFQPKDEAAIKAMWSIGQAVATGLKDPSDIEALANDLFAMVDRVKAQNPAKTAENAPQKREWDALGKEPDPEMPPDFLAQDDF